MHTPYTLLRIFSADYSDQYPDCLHQPQGLNQNIAIPLWLHRFCWSKVLPPLALLFTFIIVTQAGFTQANQVTRHDSILKSYTGTIGKPYTPAQPYFAIVGKHNIPSTATIVREVDEQLFIVKLTSQKEVELFARPGSMVPVNDRWKLSPAAERTITSRNLEKQSFILTGLDTDIVAAVVPFSKQGVEILQVKREAHSIVVNCRTDFLVDSLLPMAQLIFVDVSLTARTETGIIGYDRSLHGINAVDHLLVGANGHNIVAGVKEQEMDTADIDLWKRVLPSPIASTSGSGHATVIASIIGGAGNSFYDGRGIAWRCSFFPSSFANLFADDEAVLRKNRVTVQNHSYGTVIQQFYGAEAASYDALCWRNKEFVAVLSAGNQGDSNAVEGRYAGIRRFANLTGNFKMAKNVITVGAIDNNESVATQSSAGPLYDGRLAPQLTALGPNGTSDAAAIVTGTVAVIQQVYADSNAGAMPPASLTKAVLYNNTDDIYHSGIDYKTGYGLINSFASIQAIREKHYDGGFLQAGQQWTRSVVVPRKTGKLRITLSWTDSAATVNNNRALLNDLDLEVRETATGKLFQPWVLTTFANPDSLALPPTRKRDSLNTAEQVSIDFPNAGSYEVTVRAAAITSPVLPFHIAFTIDTVHTFYFTNPQNAAELNPEKNKYLPVRWTSVVADTNETAELYVTFDQGVSWQLLQSSAKLANRSYQWQVKDTSCVAGFKMETSFGIFYSSNFILNKVTRVTVDFNCVDSFRLSWSPHVYATGYRIYRLSDSPYLQPFMLVADTFAVFNRSGNVSNVYAVEPLLSNGLPAVRSAAIDIQLQGVRCFYKAFNYILTDNDQLQLLLELSTSSYADSVFFENVTQSGSLNKTYGGRQVSGSLLYQWLVADLPSGTTYVRGRIKLKNGANVYTDIIPIVTAGKKNIWFFPNPVKAGISLRYTLRQGVPTDSRLQLFDMYGRLLRSYTSLRNNISTSGLRPGVIVYRFTNSVDGTVETGKLLVL